MGLACAEEIQPWFYLRGTSLGDEYQPPFETTVGGAPAPSLGTLRTDFEQAFSAATGGRGRVVTTVSAPRSRRRSIRK